jgi:M6 family metalloprotease-like protein
MLHKVPFILIGCVILVAGTIMFSSTVEAVSLHPDLLKKMRQDGTLDEYVQEMKAARERGVWSSRSAEPRRFTLSSGAAQDTFRLIILLADFDDQPWTDGPDGTVSFFEDLIFSEGVWETGSVRDFYLENSYGKLVIAGEVYGWYRMPRLYSEYTAGARGMGPCPGNAGQMAQDAVSAADADVDFSLYDNNGDGYVEGLIVVHSGPGAEITNDPYDIHSHQWTLCQTKYVDGVSVRNYLTVPEEQPETFQGADNLCNIGVICHEMGHLLFGLPDLYDTDYSSSGIGDWSLMAGGSWNGSGQSPADYDAWCKYDVGFLDAIDIDSNEIGHVFPPVVTSGHVVKLWPPGLPDGVEYFLVENRTREGFDSQLPGEGLLIYHIDENKSGNSDEDSHYKVAIMQADGKMNLENNQNQGDPGDVYPGSFNVREFSDKTDPNSMSYGFNHTEIAVWDISNAGDTMTANLDVVFSRPWFDLVDSEFDESAGGDGDGDLELGEDVEFYFDLQNDWADGENVVATLIPKYDESVPQEKRVMMLNETVNLGAVTGHGGISGNTTDPITFRIPEFADSLKVDWDLVVDHDGLGDSDTFTVSSNIGGSKVLIVADDGDTLFGQYAGYFTDALDSIRFTYDVWDKEEMGTPGFAQLKYPAVIWFTGDHRASSVVQADLDFMSDYIGVYGGLFLTGQDIAQHISAVDPEFLSKNFSCTYGGSIISNYEFPSGIAGSFVDDGEVVLNDPNYGAGNQDFFSYVNALDDQAIAMTYRDDGQTAAVEIDNGQTRAVLASFGFEAISSYPNNQTYMNHASFMQSVVDFLIGRQAAPYKPPLRFSLLEPGNGDTVEVDTVRLIWSTAKDIDPDDEIQYTVQVSIGDANNYIDAGETNDTTFLYSAMINSQYFWRVVAEDVGGLTTDCEEDFMFETTGDITPPSFTIDFIPNSVVPFELDLFLFPSEELVAAPDAVIDVPGEDPDVELTAEMLEGRTVPVYALHYRVTEPGLYGFEICGEDLAGLSGCSSTSVSMTPIHVDKPTILVINQGAIKIGVPAMTSRNDGLLLALERSSVSRIMALSGVPEDFEVLAGTRLVSNASLSGPVTLTLNISGKNLSDDDLDDLLLLRIDEDRATIEKAIFDRNEMTVTAEVQQFGEYVLGKSAQASDDVTEAITPDSYNLSQNWPNPFNAGTMISFELPDDSHVDLAVYNVLGQRVVTLLDKHMPSGQHTVFWDGNRSDGLPASSGVYFYRIETESFTKTKQMVLLK